MTAFTPQASIYALLPQTLDSNGGARRPIRSGRRTRRFKSCHPDHLSMVLSGSTAVTRLLDGELRDASRKDFSRSLE